MRRATTARVQALCGCRETKKFIGFAGGDFKRECVRRGQNTFVVTSRGAMWEGASPHIRTPVRQVDQKLYLAVSIMLRGVP
ncbi:hypothetical protein SAMN04490193_3036 [Pseudomonas marginalis]|nr:hypothetical protein [Pseudomonas sp. 8 R 14]SEC55629.1 hypothetical protein SAMN04490193_3036 [Pseudomonas marginalis]